MSGVGVVGCGGSSIEGAAIERAKVPWVIGADKHDEVRDADIRPPDEPERKGQESPERLEADTGIDIPEVEAPVEDTLPPPDDFPGPDAFDCAEGETCQLAGSEICFEGRCNALGDCIPTPIYGCCEDDEGCQSMVPQSACEAFRCQDNTCSAFERPGCCSTSIACEDGDACTLNSCLNGPGGRCVHCPLGCDCPNLATPHSAAFDGQTLFEDAYGVSDQHADNVTWRLSTRRFISPPSAAWLGDADCPTYYSGELGLDCQPSAEGANESGRVQAELVGPAFALPSSPGGYIASFWLWSDVEPLAEEGMEERDLLRIELYDFDTGFSWPLSSSLALGKSTGGAWQHMALDLSPWEGSTVSLRFAFDTLDGYDNHHEGVYIDEIRVEPRCATGCCEVDADCPSEEGAEGSCSTRHCVTLADGAGGTCLDKPSLADAICDPCIKDEDCNDGNACTADTCGDDGLCQHLTFCCLETDVYATSFEEGLGDWYLIDAQAQDEVTWVSSDTSASDGQWSAWFTNPATGTYEGEGAVQATLQTPHIQLPSPESDEGTIALRFDLNLSTEWDGFVYDNPAAIDRLRVDIVTASAEPIEIWSSDEVGGSTQGAWVGVSIPLTSWSSQSVQLRVVFDSGDGERNNYAGPRIDNVKVGQVCP